jgi:hypothetical protein
MKLKSSWKNDTVEMARPNLKGCSAEEDEDHQIKRG